MDPTLYEHYKSLAQQYGSSYLSAQYSSRESQERRYEILSQIAPLQGCKILDFGCGAGHLLTYLTQSGIQCDYTGVDGVEDFFPLAKKVNPHGRFGYWDEFAAEQFDYAFVSGVFNNRMADNVAFYQQTLRELFARVRHGMAFNMLSSYVDYFDEGLFYVSPEQVFTFVKRELTPFVTLRHDYLVKAGSIPFEFAVYAYKQG